MLLETGFDTTEICGRCRPARRAVWLHVEIQDSKVLTHWREQSSASGRRCRALLTAVSDAHPRHAYSSQPKPSARRAVALAQRSSGRAPPVEDAVNRLERRNVLRVAIFYSGKGPKKPPVAGLLRERKALSLPAAAQYRRPEFPTEKSEIA